MTDTWFIFNNQGKLAFNTENPLHATTDYLPLADRPGYIVKNPVGYDITKTITYDIANNEVIIGDFSLDISPDETEPVDVVSVVGDIETFNNQITTINTKLDNLENITNSNSTSITNIENTISIMQSQINNIEQTISSLQNFNLTGVDISSLNSLLSALQTNGSIVNTITNISNVTNEIITINTQVQGIEATISSTLVS